ncbi:MAG: hypothetical protein AAGK02_12750, partial [Pseudomonadota bacterium]
DCCQSGFNYLELKIGCAANDPVADLRAAKEELPIFCGALASTPRGKGVGAMQYERIMPAANELVFRLLSTLIVLAATLAIIPFAFGELRAEPSDVTGIETGEDAFVFSGWQGPSMTVWTYVPPSVDRQTAPVTFIMHGARRDPERYRRQWIDKADKGGFIILAPEFSRDDFPRAQGYNLGGTIDLQTGEWRDEALWSFSAIEPIFDEVVERLGGSQLRYTIYGHSAGSQFVHRFLFFKPDARVKRYLAANAGWYTFADLETDFPFGLGGLPIGEEDLRAALAKDVVLLLGDQDSDPEHTLLNRSDGAMLQGPHRFARGQAFFEQAQTIAAENGWQFGWSLRVVEGVAHSNGGMAAGAYDLIE